jgi:hypothetical protein
MLRGSILHGYANVGRKFSRACKQAMDGDVALVQPWTSELNIAAMGLLATITISAVLTVIMALRAPKSGADDEPPQGHHSGSLTLA